MSDEENEFMKQICLNPKDDTARLVFADWLQEHGHDDRAQFIRLQIEYGESAAWHSLQSWGRRADLTARAYEVFSRNGANREAWAGRAAHGLAVLGTAWTEMFPWFSRGFVSHVTCEAEQWRENADKLVYRPQRRCSTCGHAAICGQVMTEDAPDKSGNRRWSTKTCPACKGSKTEPRPFAGTESPVEKVTLTTWPGYVDIPHRMDAETAAFAPTYMVEAVICEELSKEWNGIEFEIRD